MPDALDAWHRAGETLRFGEHAVFYRSTGRGEAGSTLLCVHGLPTASWDFHRIWPALEARFGLVLAPDMLGFGFSAKPRGYAYSIAQQADLHEQLLRESGVARFHVLAHDYGVTVAQELLARYQERLTRGDTSLRIESICFLNGGLFPETHRPLLIQKLMLTRFGPLLSRGLGFRAFSRSFSRVFGPQTKPSRAELEQFWRLLTYNEGTRELYRLFHYIPERSAQRARWVGALQRGGVPLRLINGPEDPVSGAHLAERYRALIPGADIVSLPGIGHYPQVESPDGVLVACAPLWPGAPGEHAARA
jgi:pimeloyl-ACP methyl ester carboxylesterase